MTSCKKLWLYAGATALWAATTPVLADHPLVPGPQSHFEQMPLGVSGSDQAFLKVKNLLYCYTGTLGALVTKVADTNKAPHILSNNHVLAKENGNLNSGYPGEGNIIQPGLLDEGDCTLDSGDGANAVAGSVVHIPIEFGKGRNKPDNIVDAAIATVTDTARVDSAGSILGIGTVVGTVDETAVAIAVAEGGMPVQKTGRTTAHTFGKVVATGVAVDVGYESGKARFVNQIRIRRPCGDAGFSAGGDSGSLIVTVPSDSNDPAAVGLLFAGSDTDTFANPIDDVLSALSVSLVGANDGNDLGAMISDYNTVESACLTDGGGGGNGGPPGGGGPPGRNIAKEVKDRHSGEIFALPDVVGHGVGGDENGNAVIENYVSGKGRRAVGRPFPSELEGVAVRVIETGPVRAY